MLVKNTLKKDHPYYFAKTEKGWKQENRIINPDAKGVRMWCNGYRQASALYYTFEQTHKPSLEELVALKEDRRNRQKKYAMNRETRREAAIRENEAGKWQVKIEEMDRSYRDVINNILHFISSKMPADIPSKAVVFDLETTGLSAFGEILQISIMDTEDNVLLNTYVKPYMKTEWPDAEQIHGITPQMVKNAPYIHEILPDIKAFFNGAITIIGYNHQFDIGVLKRFGVDLTEKKQIDVMQEFAPIYGEWNEYYQNYKWKSLSTCASYFGYEFQAHDALEDAKATLYCYKQIKLLMDSGEYEKILNRNHVDTI